MTLEQIKIEITAKLKEVRESSRDFSGCESYDDLQSLFKKAIGRVALCETPEEIEAVGDLLMAIEELYNDCNSEILNQPSDIELFTFDFELDDDSDNTEEASEEDEADETEDESEETSGSDEYEEEKAKKQSKQKEKIGSDQKEDRKDRTAHADVKSTFDQKYSADKLRKPTIMRICVGFVAIISGIGFGIVDALFWPWIWQAWAMIGFGVSYLILSAIYAIAIRIGSKKAVRSMAFTRLVLAAVMLVASFCLGFLLSEDLTLGGAFIATLPFTVFGIFTYLIYRLRLFFISTKIKSKKSK